MCGRAYETYTAAELAALNGSEDPAELRWVTPNYNLAPTETSPVLLVQDSVRVVRPFRWGLVPSWAKSIQSTSKYALINARGEEISKKPTYATPFRRKRCVVPLSGFYEWQRTRRSTRPFAIHLREQPIMPVAAVWEHWQPPDHSAPVFSFAIVTTTANDFMANIHERMPLILSPQTIGHWLDPEIQDPDHLLPLVRPCPSEWLSAYEISPLVNSPTQKTVDVLRPTASSTYQRTLTY